MKLRVLLLVAESALVAERARAAGAAAGRMTRPRRSRRRATPRCAAATPRQVAPPAAATVATVHVRRRECGIAARARSGSRSATSTFASRAVPTRSDVPAAAGSVEVHLRGHPARRLRGRRLSGRERQRRFRQDPRRAARALRAQRRSRRRARAALQATPSLHDAGRARTTCIIRMKRLGGVGGGAASRRACRSDHVRTAAARSR